MIYEAINSPVLARIPKTATRILDLGCGAGSLGRAVKSELGCEVVGVTHSESEATQASAVLNKVLVVDLDELDPAGLGEFQCIVCSHILEHLRQPERLLKLIRRNISPGGVLLVALPNVLHWKQRVEFLKGRFRYTDGGLMDRTHLRFYDWETAHSMLAGSGYTVLERAACGGFPLSRYAFGIKRPLDRAALRFFPGLFGEQFILAGRPALG